VPTGLLSIFFLRFFHCGAEHRSRSYVGVNTSSPVWLQLPVPMLPVPVVLLSTDSKLFLAVGPGALISPNYPGWCRIPSKHTCAYVPCKRELYKELSR
jgi:hypothetical protein